MADAASAATCSWHGGFDLKWSTAGNWINCASRAPQNGDSLVFPANAATFTSQNDIANLQIASVTISSPRFIISGVGIVMPAGQVLFNGSFYSNEVSGASFLVPITLTGPLTITNTSPDLMQLSVGDINLNGNTLDFDTGVFINELGAISGFGRVEKDSSGSLKIFADGSFTGPFNINGGIVVATTAHALGASGSDNGIFLRDQTNLVFQTTSNFTVAESIAFLGTNAYLDVEGTAQVTFTGPIQALPSATDANYLDADTPQAQMVLAGPVTGALFGALGHGLITFASSADSWNRLTIASVTVRAGAPGAIPTGSSLLLSSGTLDLNGVDVSLGGLAADGGLIQMGTANLTVTIPSTMMSFVKAGIAGTGTLTKAGGGVLGLQNTPNTVLAGPTIVAAGNLLLAGTANKNTITGPITINGGTLEIGADEQIGDQVAVTINSPGALKIDNRTETIGSLAGSGNVVLGTSKLITGGNNTSTTFSGVISGNADVMGRPFIKMGSGAMTLAGQHAYTGVTTVIGGTLVVDGSLLSSGTVDVENAAIAGIGSMGNLDSHGSRISPGHSPGILHTAFTNITAASLLAIELNGQVAGSGYSQLDVSGDVTLSATSSPSLFVSRGFGPPQGAQFTIVNVAAGKHLTGTFNSLPEGAILNLNGQHFSITYKGGDGNDVVLTAVDHAPAVTYYLSEGATGAFFDEDVLIANPNATDAPVTLTFSKEDGSQVTATQTVPAQSHATVHVDAIPGMEATAASTQVRSEQGLPLVVERTMFWDASYYAGHTGSAVDQPASDWFFAEGSQGFFNTYVLVINPNATPTDVFFTFLREGDTPVTKTVTVGASTRLTLDCGTVPEIVNRSFGITVHASQPIMAERSMYFGTTATRLWSGGTESAGVTALSTHWFLAEGATGGFFDTFILLSNPNSVDANVTLQYLLDTGDTVSVPKVVPANARLTTNIETEADQRLHNAAVSTVVTSDQPIIAERSMYWPGAAVPWGEGHNSFGVVEAGLHWGLAEGRVGGPFNFHSYILLANPQTTAANVTVTFLREHGAAVVTRTFTVPATSRFNIDTSTIAELHDEAFGADIQVTNGVAIIVERSMYWDSNGFQFSGGTNATGARLP